MIKHGIALCRLSSSPGGYVEGPSTLEEFYVVMFEGHLLPTRFPSYAEAFAASKKLYAEARADVA